MTTVIGILIALICMVVCHTVARKRGATTIKWAVLGAGLGPLAIPFSFLSKPKKVTQVEQRTY